MPSILWSAPVPPAAKHPYNMMLPPPCFTVGILFFSLQHPPFSSKHNDGHYGQTVLFLFHQIRGHLSIFVPMCSLQTVVWLFYGGFGAVASSLLSGLSGYVKIGLVLLWIYILLYLFPPASSQGPLLLFWDWFALFAQSSLGDRTRLLPERYAGCMVPWCLYLRTIVCTDERGTFRCLEIPPKDEPDLWRSTKKILRSVLLIFPWCQAKRYWVWR